MIISAGNLSFVINEDGSHAQFIVNNNQGQISEISDYWRLILDDGFYTELAVCSHMQKGRVTCSEKGMKIEYDQVVSEYGEVYPIRFSVNITVEDDLLKFSSSIYNQTENVRVNECLCPFVEFTKLCGEKEKDVLYMPHGLGERKLNPWGYMNSDQMVLNFYNHNEFESAYRLYYPGTASMSWFGIESGNEFLYMAKYDSDQRGCFLTVRQTIRSNPTNLMLSVNQFPATRSGEKMTLSPIFVGLLDGDWRKGAQRYRTWAESTFYNVPQKHEWVQHMTGWQRIIMRSQWGHDHFKPEDLPEVYRIGAQYGLHTIFIFGWWKGGFDRNYPDCYAEPLDGLAENIKKVQEMGGRIILVCLPISIDEQSDYYKNKGGDELQVIDINGNIPHQQFTFVGPGDLRITFGQRYLINCCSGTQRWRDELMGFVKQLNELGADCAFMDCYGVHPAMPCFNDKHEHGPRVDEDWISRKKFYREAVEYTKKQNIVLAAECVSDIASSFVQFLHGWLNVDFADGSDVFAPMFRYTFPEMITTLRGIRCSVGHYERQFKGALTAGLRVDAELYVCRATIDRDPEYARVVGWYTSKLAEYSEFFLDGQYTVLDGRWIPKHIRRGEYISQNGRKVLRVLLNASDYKEEVYGVDLEADEIRFDVFEKDEYLQMPGVIQ